MDVVFILKVFHIERGVAFVETRFDRRDVPHGTILKHKELPNECIGLVVGEEVSERIPFLTGGNV